MKKKKRQLNDLFVPVATIKVVELQKPFRAEDTFFGKSEVKIASLGSNFTVWFGKKVETEFPESDPIPVDLARYATNEEIVAALGGENKAEVTLAEIWRLMKRQPHGEQRGLLLANGYANIFYVRDINGVLRTVYVGWGAGGWDVHADPVAGGWYVGSRVFSRNS